MWPYVEEGAAPDEAHPFLRPEVLHPVLAHRVGPGTRCSPRHRTLFNSRSGGFETCWMTLLEVNTKPHLVRHQDHEDVVAPLIRGTEDVLDAAREGVGLDLAWSQHP